jgi:hypothetical protein
MNSSPAPRPGAARLNRFLLRNRRTIVTSFVITLLLSALVTLVWLPIRRVFARVLPPPGADLAIERSYLLTPALTAQSCADGMAVGLYVTDPPPDGEGGLMLAVDGLNPDQLAIVANAWAAAYAAGGPESRRGATMVAEADSARSTISPRNARNVAIGVSIAVAFGILCGLIADGLRSCKFTRWLCVVPAPPGYPAESWRLESFWWRNRRILVNTFVVVFAALEVVTFMETPAYRAVARVLPAQGDCPQGCSPALSPILSAAASVSGASSDDRVRLSLCNPPPDGGGGTELVVDSDNPDVAADKANQWAATYVDAQAHRGVTAMAIRTDIPLYPDRPKKMQNSVFAAIVAAMLGVVAVAVAEVVRKAGPV